MKKCDRCGKEKKDVKALGTCNYINENECAKWEYSACADCAEVIGCAMDNYFFEFARNWKIGPKKEDQGPQIKRD